MTRQGQLVTRNELKKLNSSSRESSSSDSDIRQLTKAKLEAHFGAQQFVTIKALEAKPAQDLQRLEKSVEEHEFRLFSTSHPSNTIINIAEVDFDKLPPGFVVPERLPSYYFQEEFSHKQKQQVQDVLLTGEDIIRLSRASWPGCRLPWKLEIAARQGKAAAQKLQHHAAPESLDLKTKRAKANKQVRIRRRKILKIKQEEALKAKTALELKEAVLKEKRIRKNMGKKLRKKEKQKAKNMETAAVPLNSVEREA